MNRFQYSFVSLQTWRHTSTDLHIYARWYRDISIRNVGNSRIIIERKLYSSRKSTGSVSYSNDWESNAKFHVDSKNQRVSSSILFYLKRRRLIQIVSIINWWYYFYYIFSVFAYLLNLSIPFFYELYFGRSSDFELVLRISSSIKFWIEKSI